MSKNILVKKNINKLINSELDLDNYDWIRYINENKDLIEAGINTKENAIKHWIKHGKNEERKIYLLNNNINIKNDNEYQSFDWKTYIEKYEDLRKAGIDTKDKAWIHWIKYGKNEGREIYLINNKYELFDWETYIEDYDDLRKAGINTKDKAFKHWIKYGKNENRIINFNNNIKIDIDIYKLFNKDLIKLSDNELYRHFNKFGIYEDRIYDINSFNKRYNLNLLSYYDIINYYNKNIKNKKIIYMYVPFYDKTNKHGGIHALYNFYNLLKNNDIFRFQLILFYFSSDVNVNNKIVHKNISIDDNDIVIYTEVIDYNPLNAKNIIRWILLGLGIGMNISPEQYKKWNKNDAVFHWVPMDKKIINYNQLFIPFLNNTFYNKKKIKNNKICYLLKKGFTNFNGNLKNMLQLRENLKKNNECMIDDLPLNNIIEILNDYSYMYTYDPVTAYTCYAIICECIPIISPYIDYNGYTYTKDEYIKNFMTYQTGSITHGFAYGNTIEEINFAKQTLQNGIDEVYKLFDKSVVDYNINNFINIMDETYNKNNNIYIKTINDIYYI